VARTSIKRRQYDDREDPDIFAAAIAVAEAYQEPQEMGGADCATSTSSAGSHTRSFTTGPTGSGNAHSIVQPSIVVNYIILRVL
jgi:microcystin-dependent protein